MSYLVFARKYRPRTFDEVVGQEAVATTLKNAITGDRVAHAYLFTGPRGVGKTSMARILAKALNCEKGPTAEPCNKCAICKSIDNGDDVDVVEIDGASNNTVDEARLLRENARYVAARSRFRIYVIDEVHMLSNAAFNALLKTLEEPPPHVKFIFATTEPHKLPATIRSRCQRFDFHRIASSAIADHLREIAKKEKIKAEEGVLEAIARSAHGGMRDAESLLDQLASLSSDKVTRADLEQLVGAVSEQVVFDLVGAVAAHDARKAVEIADRALARGAADDELMQQLVDGFRELLLVRVGGPDTALVDRTGAERQAVCELADRFSTDALMYLVQMFAETKRRARESSQARIVFELALIKAAEIHQLRPLDELVGRLRTPDSGAAPAGGSGVPRGRPAEPPAPARTAAAEQGAAAAAPRPPPARTGDLWTDTLALVEQEKTGLAAFIRDATVRPAEKPLAADRPHYVIELDPFAASHARANKDLIERALSEVHGKPCLVEFRHAPRAPAARPEPAAETPQGDHIRKAMGLFKARVVNTSERKERDTDGQRI